MAYDNTNSGAAFLNDDKRSGNSPDFRGSLDVEGTEYWVSVWVKVAGPSAKSPGSKFLSMALTPKEEKRNPMSPDPLAGFGDGATPAPTTKPLPDMPDVPSVPVDDDLPF